MSRVIHHPMSAILLALMCLLPPLELRAADLEQMSPSKLYRYKQRVARQITAVGRRIRLLKKRMRYVDPKSPMHDALRIRNRIQTLKWQLERLRGLYREVLLEEKRRKDERRRRRLEARRRAAERRRARRLRRLRRLRDAALRKERGVPDERGEEPKRRGEGPVAGGATGKTPPRSDAGPREAIARRAGTKGSVGEEVGFALKSRGDRPDGMIRGGDGTIKVAAGIAMFVLGLTLFFFGRRVRRRSR